MRSRAKWILKHAIIVLLKYLGVLWLARKATTQKGFLIIGWHGVSLADEHERFRTLFISAEQLERRVQFLNRALKIVTLDECLIQKEANSIAPGQVVLTFDDGYYNFLKKAVPVLDRYQAPAINYVVSARMLDERSKPNLLLRDCIYRASLAKLRSFCVTKNISLSPNKATAKKAAEKKLLAMLDQLPADEKDCFADEVGMALGINVSEIRRERFWTSMTTEEVGQLARSNPRISLQLHSHEHINSIELGNGLGEDLRKCRNAIESASGVDASDFCYPSGLWAKSTWPALTENAIRSAVTTRRGPNLIGTHNFSLRRVMDGGANSQLEFELEVSGLKWLVHSWLNPKSRTNPSEKTARYRESGIRY